MVCGQENFNMYFPKEQSPEAICIGIRFLESHIMRLEKKFQVSIYQENLILLKLVINCESEYKQLFGKKNK